MEYFLLIFEFYVTGGFWKFLKFVLIPTVVGLFVYYFSNDIQFIESSTDFHNNIISVLGILIGFTISVFTILVTVTNANIEEAKQKVKCELFGKGISLFETVVIGLAYLILIQGFLLIANFIYPLFIPIKTIQGKLFFSINLSIVIHVILILMRSVLDVYFILTKKK